MGSQESDTTDATSHACTYLNTAEKQLGKKRNLTLTTLMWVEYLIKKLKWHK